MASIPQKVRILRFAAEQGVVSLDDVARFLHRTDQMPAVRTALHESGLSNFNYAKLKLGIWYLTQPESLDLLQYYFPDLPYFSLHSLGFYVIEHALELNRIRFTLQESKKLTVTQWLSENHIRALSCSGMSIGHGMYPDAIFYRQRADRTQQKFVLEYEKTFKNIDRYKNIFRAYSRREDVKGRNVIYICKTPSIKENLEEIETRMAKTGELEGAGLFFQFIVQDDFYRTYNNPKQEEGNGQQTQTISQQAYA